VKRISIFPSILSADFSRLGEQIRTVEGAGADGIHLDIMDGHFVPNLTIGPHAVQSIRKVTRLPFWAHLMIEEPAEFIPRFFKAGSNGILVHPENGKDVGALIDQIHDLGIHAGVALNPETGLDSVRPHLERIERILLMTVHPGFGGQEFIDGMFEKISAARKLADSVSRPPVIEVDGGVHEGNIRDVVLAGADSIVAGSAIFDSPDPAETLAVFKRHAQSAKESM
jgi:ribulose-phosphate 3-epimerase